VQLPNGGVPVPQAEGYGAAERQQKAAQAQADADDLLAQKRMAHWATVTAALTGLGVVFVILTLRAALDANRGFSESAERQLRAYISPTVTHLHVTADMTKPFPQQIVVRFDVRARNHGQTPAYESKVWAAIDYIPLPVPPNFWTTKREELTHNAVIPPQGEKDFTFTKAVMFDETALWRDPPNSIVLTGLIRYRDAFGKARYARFTGHLENLKNWWHGARNGQPVPINLRHSETGNEAD
jgi:hypothetical protein